MLYNKFRPATFNEMKGQDVNKQILINQIKDKKLVHAYIFHGLHGSGKTTAAKILAKAINCENPINGEPCNKCSSCLEFNEGTNPDIREIDAASNNKVEDVAKIKDVLSYSPLRNKIVFILDEAHMLSKSAWNSLLTTIEDDSKEVVFIFCSTELQKFPETILSRCMKLSFTAIPEKDILENLISICKKENFIYEETGLKLLSQISNGSMRDALSHLEKCIAYGDLTENNISSILGVVDQSNVFEILKKVMLGDIENSMKTLDELFFLGKDMYTLAQDLLESMRDIYIYNSTHNPKLISKDIKYVSSFEVKKEQIFKAINQFYKLLDVLRKTDNKKVILEITLLEVSTLFSNVKVKDFDFSLKNIEINSNFNENFINQIQSKETIEETSATVDNSLNLMKNNKNINYYDYLVKKIDLLESYDLKDPQLLILLKAKIYASKDGINIKTPFVDKLNQQDIINKFNNICNRKLNINFKK